MNTRRHFLTTLSGAAAATALKAQDTGLTYKGENIQYGLVTYQWGAKWDIETLLKNLDGADVRGVELRVEHAHGVNPELTSDQRNKVRSQFTDVGVEIIGMGCNWEFHSPDAEVVKKNMEGAKQYLKLSHDIGGSGVKVKPNQLPKEVPVDKTLEQIGKCLAELADYGSGFGQQVRLEVHGGVSDLAHIRKVMEVADRDSVRVCWNSNKQDLEGGIEANFAKVKDYLGATTHVRETSAADYPWETLARLLVEADYAGWVCLEGHKPPTGDAVEALKAEKARWQEWIRTARKTVK
jgi:sugar phosphate isomerase/epimerase